MFRHDRIMSILLALLLAISPCSALGESTQADWVAEAEVGSDDAEEALVAAPQELPIDELPLVELGSDASDADAPVIDPAGSDPEDGPSDVPVDEAPTDVPAGSGADEAPGEGAASDDGDAPEDIPPTGDAPEATGSDGENADPDGPAAVEDPEDTDPSGNTQDDTDPDGPADGSANTSEEDVGPVASEGGSDPDVSCGGADPDAPLGETDPGASEGGSDPDLTEPSDETDPEGSPDGLVDDGTDETDAASEAEGASPLTLSLAPEASALVAGSTYPLSQLVVVLPAEADIDWASAIVHTEDPSIAVPNDTGDLLALAEGDTAIDIALADGASLQGTVTVIDPGTADLLADMAQLAAQLAASPAQGIPIDCTEVRAGLSGIQGNAYAWTGQPICPSFTLSYNGTAMVKNRDYCLQYRNNTEPGTAAMLVMGLGEYTGSITVTYRIQAKPDIFLKPEALILGVGERWQLAYADNGARFVSSNRKVATVSSTGLIKAVKKGRATISMLTGSGTSLSCSVTVKPKAKRIALSAKKLTLGIGQAKALNVKLKPSGCRAGVTWSTSDADVAIVSDGVIIPVRPGKATVTARTYSGKKAKCVVTVKAAPTSVTLSKAAADLPVGGRLTLKASVSPAGSMLAGSFSSSDTAIATVNSSGKVVGKKTGQAVIRYRTYNGATAECAVKVWKVPRAVSLDRKTATMAVGQVLKLNAVVADADAYPVVKWASSKKKLATVDGSGNVTAKKTGKVKIRVKTCNGKTATCTIRIYARPTRITVKAAQTTLYVGEYTKAAAALNKGSYSVIEWYSEGSAVTVDQSGRIDAVAPGTSVVYARAASAPGVIGKVTITVRSIPNVKGAIIDISKWQGSIDFKKLKPSVAFVIARASCNLTQDTKFETYAAAMNAQGIPFGVYCYSKASTAAQAKAEAKKLYEIASRYNPRFYVMDAEEACITQAAVVAFMDQLRSCGAAKVGAYVGHHRYGQYGIKSIRSKFDFLWIPRYGSNDGTIDGAIKPAYECDLWQYTSMGKLPGIPGRVDMNVLTGTGRSLGWFIS
ncbi:MAG: Ig-like domain-containing protein [Clostridia bacterium]|nr:Ig-like domain-containing protein [Clostridia bacterium]